MINLIKPIDPSGSMGLPAAKSMKRIIIIAIPLMLMLNGISWSESRLESARWALMNGDWKTVERLLATADNVTELLVRGEAWRAQGYLDRASGDHETAWRCIAGQESPLRNWAARTSAETLLARYHYIEAEQRLHAASTAGDAEERIRREITQGRLEAAQGHTQSARLAYLRAREQAQRAGFHGLNMQSQLGLITLDSTFPSPQEIKTIIAEIDKIDHAHTKAALLLGLAEHARRSDPQVGYALAQSLVIKATPLVAEGRQRAELLALSAALLEATGHPADALILTAQAISEAQRIDAGDLMMREEWRRGRLYHTLGDSQRALLALRRAVFHLRMIRSDISIPMEYYPGRSSFREILSPLYLKLADLLLQQAAALSEDDAQPLLREARDTLERLKTAELEDYLGSACPLDTKSVANLELIAPRTGVLYPILLPDRLELLLGINGRQYRTTVAVKSEEIRTAAENLASLLRPAPDLMNPKFLANQLFSWIIAPVKHWLDKHQVDTLVFIPDGPLRLFPLGALMDGDTFLIERYAVVTEPGLTLFDPQPIPRKNIHALVAGMSRPGPVIEELPKDLLTILTGTNGSEPLRLGEASLSQRNRESLEETLALPGVEQEVKQVSAVLGVPPMLNQDFVLSRFTAAMDHSLHIVHMASHGFFGGTPENSFFMTYDRLLKIHHLETLLQGNGKDKQPPQLLILSACQTAEGNDRAPLGITGVAVKSGVRSVIGSLWPVSDDATQRLIGEFYPRLRDSRQTKAMAFQQAQIAVLRDQRFNHPFFWAAFILVGNWL
ncbi:CHAT domain-containing protein [Gammaproteobacteria bacterium]